MPRKKKRANKKKTVKKEKKLALVSVSDKTGIEKFVRELKQYGYNIVSTGGTSRALRKAKLRILTVEDVTGSPHMFDGRVKSLHPKIHGGILADRNNPEHVKDMKKYKIRPIDIVVCNLYPFEKVLRKDSFTHEEAIENIDIGGPTMVRASAKNYSNVAIVVDPSDYKVVLSELKRNNGEISYSVREDLARKAFEHTARYDSLIYAYLRSKDEIPDSTFPKFVDITLEKIQGLRYGENPHQKAAFYKEIGIGNKEYGIGITNGEQLHGKELSFNNIVDMDAAWAAATYFAKPCVAIIKHTNPCGLAEAENLTIAYKRALEGDPVSAFGSIVACNREVDEAAAKEMSSLFIEVIIAPAFSKGALAIFKQKKNLRIIEMGKESLKRPFRGYDYKRVSGGLLIQDADTIQLAINDIKVATTKQPSLGEMEDLFFAWGVCKHVKSNAIVIAKNSKVLGVGAGQMSRIDAAGLAVNKSGEEVKGSVLASDAFFPFKDVVEFAAKYGISAIIQPGGSKRDQESIDAANQHGMVMVFTGRRHFKH
ncbi:MAG: bifunctional phosphoribosylaminoimidazolecarboxamide formyltransferase/IMP cyclohydrolase [Candidatus Margulisbacteria bacterium]|nr:bifunctional phosphoribosylaminoimidazolecarboxamide formyltransferase/IMP cyclohydrolase [Candidatus Margulisiibacteriota bacterium]MBU1021348.1 bifunctional phosphoribosylaminoimidazolecarboxamide formyltransferase/IMP cyclohydrolase [Candidatus Margulisiibacteriota bacterium]MBU1729163.1 bifunctional phosphoribosylaminoimidazolecarboxamide formyltransferase/IMP cyclohydrolase [Candidatus Margulisiibacteriota bacterium]MBU1954836.1 bifunctional phosphoribosylaminoimidazolecarboxamide formyl